MAKRLVAASPRRRLGESGQQELLFDARTGVVTVTLNRPAALNALSYYMIEELTRRLAAWEKDEGVRSIVLRGAGGKAFCAGGDLRAVYRSVTGGNKGHMEFYRLEYTLDYLIHTYRKPIVAVIDGIVMGGGMGISQGAALRIVGPRTVMAMPETGLGLFPDVGGSYFLSRTPGCLGYYLGMVGVSIDAADAIYAGLADGYIPGYVPSDASSMNPRHLEYLRPAIDRHFSAGSPRAILASLGRETDPMYKAWAVQTQAALRRRSPTMLEVTHELLRRGALMSLGDCFRMELELVHGCIELPDLVEGIRALIIDKDKSPRWKPATLEEVKPQAVAQLFTPRWERSQHPLANLERDHPRP